MNEKDLPAIHHREANQNLWHDVKKLEVKGVTDFSKLFHILLGPKELESSQGYILTYSPLPSNIEKQRV